jgi:ribosomal protein S18 acetylase RimI-like enzyme
MTASNIQIRKLLPSDARSYREIRLEALAKSPEAFGSSVESEAAHALSWFEDRLASSEVFGAFRDDDLLGVAGYYIAEGPKRAHKATLWGMYVRPQARNMAVGRRLAVAVIDAARPHVELIQLCVVSENQVAMRIYSGLGFLEYGLEKNALKQDGRYYDQVLMALPLASIAPTRQAI